MNVKIWDVVFWVALVIGIVMVLWRVFGNSPTDLQVVAPFIVMGFSKMWGMNERLVRLEMKTGHGFRRAGEDIGLIRQDINLIKERLEIR